MTLEIIGIVLLTCPRCNKQHVANTESLQSGVTVICKCGFQKKFNPGSKVNLSIAEAAAPWMPSEPVKRDFSHLPRAVPGTLEHRGMMQEREQHKQAVKDHKQYVASVEREQRQNDAVNHTLPLEEYKLMLSGLIVTGKKPKVQKKNSNTVSFNDNSAEIRNSVEALIHYGDKETDALKKVSIAIEQGFFSEQEIIKKVLSM